MELTNTFTFEGEGLMDPDAPEGTLGWHKDTVFGEEPLGATAELPGVGKLLIPKPAEDEEEPNQMYAAMMAALADQQAVAAEPAVEDEPAAEEPKKASKK